MTIRLPKNRAPTHPGVMLKEEFLDPLEVSQSELARRIGVSFQAVNNIVRGRSGVSPEMALRLAAFLGTSEGSWMNLQTAWDLYTTRKAMQKDLNKIQPVALAG